MAPVPIPEIAVPLQDVEPYSMDEQDEDMEDTANMSTVKDQSAMSVEETESMISEFDKIPTMAMVWPLLEKMGCRREEESYYLPRSCAETAANQEEEEEEVFDSISLRRHICQYGIPMCGRRPHGGLNEDEELLFKRWVRYAVVPFPSEAVTIPDYGQTTLQEVKLFFRDKLKVPYSGHGLFSYRGNKRLDVYDLMKIFAREGVDWDAHPELDPEEVCKIMMHVAENKDIGPYAYCTNHRPARTQAKPTPPPPKAAVVQAAPAPEPPQKAPVQKDPLRLGPPSDCSHSYWNRLGSMRMHHVAFSWGPIIGWRKGLGRAYFESFKLRELELKPGDFVVRRETFDTGEVFEDICQIITAFQALKSWVGSWDRTKNEIQKRGHCYLELQRYKLGKEHKEGSVWDSKEVTTLSLKHVREPTIPCCFLDTCYQFQKLKRPVQLSQKKRGADGCEVHKPPIQQTPQELAAHHAAWCWDRARHAEQVKFTHVADWKGQPRNSHDLPLFDADTSDDSDGESQKPTPVKRPARKPPPPNSLVSQDWFPPCDPLPQIVVENLTFDDDTDAVDCIELKRDLEMVSALIGKYEGVMALVREIELKLKLVQPLTQLVELNPRTVDKRLEPELQSALVQLGFKKFRNGLQRDVCLAALESPPEDVMCAAPCGFGKSMCFVLPTIIQGGITLVIEPLRTLVENLVTCLSGKEEYDVVALLNLEDARRTKKERDYANTLLGELAVHCEANVFTLKPIIIVAVAELVNKKDNLDCLQVLAAKGALKRIVVDEFDVIEESHEKYRETYTNLVPNVRDACHGVPFMFLSGTTTKSVMMKVLASPEHKTTKVFTHARALADNLVFSVERKQDNEQVAKRILCILSTYLEANHDLPGPLKVLCCCLTRDKCKEMKDYLLRCNNSNLDIQVEVVTSDTNRALQTPNIVKAFRETSSKAVHILCVTKALGRGFHADDIRFVFHTIIPLSPSNYIQEAGRAGRGNQNQVAYCTLFFREQDCSIAANVTNQHRLEDLNQFNHDELEKVIRYCRSGDCCRYAILASFATLPECSPWSQKCHRKAQCDYCSQCSPFQSAGPTVVEHKEHGQVQLETRRLEVTDLIEEMLPRYEHQEKASHRCDEGRAWSNKSDGDRLNLGEKIWQDCFQRLAGGSEVQSVLAFGSQSTCLANEIYRFLARFEIVKPGRTICSLQKFSERNLRVFVKNFKSVITAQDKSKVMELETVAQVCLEQNDDVVPDDEMTPTTVTDNVGGLSFILQFEKRRGRRDRPEANDGTIDISSLPLPSALECLCKKKPPYLGVISRAASAGEKVDEGAGSYLFFSARLPVEAKSLVDLELLPPERALDRRIFRKFGSHRFLHVNVPGKVTKDVRKLIFSKKPLTICGREYSLLWAKHTKSPQVYVLFAEKGVGIKEEISSQEVLEWCLCPKANPDMTLGRLVKRMKLCFSKTTASGVLPEGSVEVFPDIKSPDGTVMTDGCGLVSEKALKAIWDSFWQESVVREEADRPAVMCTSFQGRLGGFKGTWVLSRSLGDEFRIVCTESQRKFNLPLKCLKDCDQLEGCDELYDTMEVCKWNNAMEEAPLNNRLIQCLESRAFGENSAKLLDLLRNRVQERCQRLTELKDPEKWFQFALKKNRQTPQDEAIAVGCTDTKMLFEMSVSGVEHSDPTFARRRKRLLGNEFKNMRKKGHYPIENARYVWIFPDFSGLLEEGEAYLALDDEVVTAEHVLALRSPSYFAEDLRKLRLVGVDELSRRKPWEKGRFGELPLPGLEFLLGLRNALILSTKGMHPEAGKMSGGDHDGDICWVCWNEELVPLVDTSKDGADLSFPGPKKSELEQKNAWTASQDDVLDFVFNHRGHQNHLGTLANMLDKTVDMLGFDHEFARAIGQQAFLQVDHPYYLCKTSESVRQAVEKLRFPHWMERDHKEPKDRSTTALGVLWDIVESSLNLVEADQAIKPDSRIIGYVHSAADVYITRDFVAQLRKQMRTAIEGWLAHKDLLKGARVEEDAALSSKREKYLQQQLKDLILKQRNDVVDRRKLAAAVLYEQAHECTKTFQKDLVQDVTWMLGLRWLLSIVGGGDKDDGAPPLTVSDAHAGVVFNKRRRV